MIRTHKIALKVNNKQATELARHCGYARVAYNHALADFKEGLDAGAFRSIFELRRRFNACKREQYPWASRLSQNAAKNALRHLGEAVQRWSGKSLAARFPVFHKRNGKQSFQADNGPDTVRVNGKRVRLPKIGWLSMREALRFEGSIRTATVVKDGGRWFVCLHVAIEKLVPVETAGKATIGVDVGIKTLAVCSDGRTFDNPKAFVKAQKKLRRIDKAIARSRNTHGKDKSSNRRTRKLRQREKLHARVKNVRLDSHHKASSAIAKTAGCVVVETLNVQGMIQNRRLARAMADAGLAQFIRLLEYKCAGRGGGFEQVSRWFPSSKMCSACGTKRDRLTLAERTFRCDVCGFEEDRDLNAALNLAAASCAEAYPIPRQGAQNGHGAQVRPPAPVAQRDEVSTEQLRFDSTD